MTGPSSRPTGRAEVAVSLEHEDRAASAAVVIAVAEARGVDELALPPLAETVDVGALDRLFDTRDRRTASRLTFTYADCRVDVSPDAVHVVQPAAPDS